MVAPTAEIGSLTSTAGSEPWEFYERVRAAGEVVWDEDLQAWLVASYDLVKKLSLDDDEIWQSLLVPAPERRILGMSDAEYVDALGHGSPRTLIINGGDDHDAIHRWWMRVFSSRVLAHWRDSLVRPIAHEQIDRFAGRGRAELCADFAERLAPRVMCAIMGLPYDDEWIARTLELNRRKNVIQARQTEIRPNPEVVRDAVDASHEQREMLEPYVEARRAGDGDDFISLTWRDAPRVWPESDDLAAEVSSTALQAFQAGAGTTSSTIGNALYLLIERPHLQERLHGADRRTTDRFVEEVLRLYAPVTYRPRRARRDVEVAAVRVSKGEIVISLTSAASRDPQRYPHPADVDLERRAPRDHFGFSMGPRTCPGQALARLQLEAAVGVVVERLDDLRLDPRADPPRWRELFLRRWAPLHVLFRAR